MATAGKQLGELWAILIAIWLESGSVPRMIILLTPLDVAVWTWLSQSLKRGWVLRWEWVSIIGGYK
jgi:hypothetical protein